MNVCTSALFVATVLLQWSMICVCGHNVYTSNIDVLFFLALPPRPKVQSTSISNQTSDNASQPSTSPTGVDRSLSSPVAAKRPASQSRSGPLSPGLQAVALYDFDGDTSLGDLVFQAGETIIDVRNVSEEWMSGRIGDRTGSFPTAFVQISWPQLVWHAGQFMSRFSWYIVSFVIMQFYYWCCFLWCLLCYFEFFVMYNYSTMNFVILSVVYCVRKKWSTVFCMQL